MNAEELRLLRTLAKDVHRLKAWVNQHERERPANSFAAQVDRKIRGLGDVLRIIEPTGWEWTETDEPEDLNMVAFRKAASRALNEPQTHRRRRAVTDTQNETPKAGPVENPHVAALKAKRSNFICPCCGNRDWVVSAEFSAPGTMAVICNRCGLINLHCAQILLPIAVPETTPAVTDDSEPTPEDAPETEIDPGEPTPEPDEPDEEANDRQ